MGKNKTNSAKMTSIKKIIKKIYLYLIGGGLGALLGYEYYQYVSCSNGTCLITSIPLITSIYGGVMGAILMSMLEPVIFKIRTKLKNKNGKN